MAPEIVYKKSYDYRVDIWSLGVLLYELIHKEAPYKGRTVQEIIGSFKKGGVNFNSTIDLQAKDLIQRILRLDPNERPSINQILNHPWVKQQIDSKELHDIIYHNIKKETFEKSILKESENVQHIKFQNHKIGPEFDGQTTKMQAHPHQSELEYAPKSKYATTHRKNVQDESLNCITDQQHLKSPSSFSNHINTTYDYIDENKIHSNDVFDQKYKFFEGHTPSSILKNSNQKNNLRRRNIVLESSFGIQNKSYLGLLNGPCSLRNINVSPTTNTQVSEKSFLASLRNRQPKKITNKNSQTLSHLDIEQSNLELPKLTEVASANNLKRGFNTIRFKNMIGMKASDGIKNTDYQLEPSLILSKRDGKELTTSVKSIYYNSLLTAKDEPNQNRSISIRNNLPKSSRIETLNSIEANTSKIDAGANSYRVVSHTQWSKRRHIIRGGILNETKIQNSSIEENSTLNGQEHYQSSNTNQSKELKNKDNYLEDKLVSIRSTTQEDDVKEGRSIRERKLLRILNPYKKNSKVNDKENSENKGAEIKNVQPLVRMNRLYSPRDEIVSSRSYYHV